MRDDPPLLGIVADDLAGAADTAAQLVSPGRASVVSLGTSPLPADAASATAVAIDADCRHVPPKECAPRIEEAFGRLAQIGAKVPYLKLDSTLRGNVGAALQAALRAVTAAGAVLAPAFPERGRTVAGGVLLVDGQPVAETEVASDGAAPVVASEVVAIVQRQWPCRAEVIKPRDFADARQLAAGLDKAIHDGAELMVMDSETPQDMELIAAALEDEKLRYDWPRILPAGSAGLARGYAALWGVRRATPLPPAGAGKRRPVLAVIGSRTSAAGAQVDALRNAGVECVTADAPDTVSRAAGLLDRQEAVVIIPGAAGHEAVAGAAAEALSRHSRETGLVLSGGATARRFCELAHIGHLWILGELQPGVAASRAERWHRIPSCAIRRLKTCATDVIATSGEVAPSVSAPLVIKGGAAGNAKAVLEAMRWIRGD